MLEGKGVAIADEVRELASSAAVLVAFDLLQTNPNHTAAPFISLGDVTGAANSVNFPGVQ